MITQLPTFIVKKLKSPIHQTSDCLSGIHEVLLFKYYVYYSVYVRIFN